MKLIRFILDTAANAAAAATAEFSSRQRITITKRNPYGDQLISTLSGFGSDVSSQRLTSFEEEILQRAMELKPTSACPLQALDLFSGYCASNAKRLAEMGYIAYAFDFSPPSPELTNIGQLLPGGGILHYKQQDVRHLDLTFLAQKLDLITAQRSLHFLHFLEAQELIGNLARHLKSGASMYFTIGAVDCKVGNGYKHADLPVELRWHPLEPELGEPIHVTEPLCLYKTEDVHSLFQGVGGCIVRLERDDFGLFVVEFQMN
ncbi:MAG: class I SAM-dependent methyltransferase [Candidatus Obscuribacterales bacterium]|nr:class I SAM-dependent methyltransferase [Candidatus Obscuribacterales bacterium]